VQGIADIRKALEVRRATGAKAVLPWFYTVLGDVYATAGEVNEGLRAAEAALRWVQRNDEALYEAEAYRLKGELLLKQEAADGAEAETCFRQAIDIARRQQAKSWELRAATSLGRLWHNQGHRHDPLPALASIYDWYTEGFDTADLQDAKALLSEIG
jgi:predicted ATPase